MVDCFILDACSVGYRFGRTSSACDVGPRMKDGEAASKRLPPSKVNEKLWNKPARTKEFASGTAPVQAGNTMCGRAESSAR